MPAAITAEEFSTPRQMAAKKNSTSSTTKSDVVVPIRALIGEAWGVFKKNWAKYYGISLLIGLVSTIMQYLIGALSESNGVLFILLLVANVFLQFMVYIGWTKILLKMTRGETIEVAELFRHSSLIKKYLVASLRVGVLIFLGFIAFIIPGIYLSIRYMFVPYLVIDQGMAAGEAMKRSTLMTKGIKLKIILLALAMMGLNVLGVLLLFVGVLITGPVAVFVSVLFYRQRLEQTA